MFLSIYFMLPTIAYNVLCILCWATILLPFLIYPKIKGEKNEYNN